MDNRPSPSYEDHRRIAMAGSSFTGKAVITLVLYWIFYVPGLIANILFYKEAREVKRVTGRAPQGMGCLSVMFWALPVLILLFVLVLIPAMFKG
jgi:hypothetical protein